MPMRNLIMTDGGTPWTAAQIRAANTNTSVGPRVQGNTTPTNRSLLQRATNPMGIKTNLPQPKFGPRATNPTPQGSAALSGVAQRSPMERLKNPMNIATNLPKPATSRGNTNTNTGGGGSTNTGGGGGTNTSNNAAAQLRAQQSAQAAAAKASQTAYDRINEIAKNYAIADPNLINPDRPEMRSGRDMADHLGVMYDRKEMERLMQDSIKTQYSNLDTEHARGQDMYYDSVAGNADMLMGAMRRGDREATMTGVTRGSQQAQELSALLGVSAEGSQGATELAQLRSDLVGQREADMAGASERALKQYNDLGVGLGQVATSELNANMVGYTGELNHDASVTAATLAGRAQQMQAMVQGAQGIHAADQALKGTKYSADQSLKGALANANAMVASASKQAQAAMAAAKTNASSNERIAAEQLANQIGADNRTRETITDLLAWKSSGDLSPAQSKAVDRELEGIFGITIRDNAKKNTNVDYSQYLPSNTDLFDIGGSRNYGGRLGGMTGY